MYVSLEELDEDEVTVEVELLEVAVDELDEDSVEDVLELAVDKVVE